MPSCRFGDLRKGSVLLYDYYGEYEFILLNRIWICKFDLFLKINGNLSIYSKNLQIGISNISLGMVAISVFINSFPWERFPRSYRSWMHSVHLCWIRACSPNLSRSLRRLSVWKHPHSLGRSCYLVHIPYRANGHMGQVQRDHSQFRYTYSTVDCPRLTECMYWALTKGFQQSLPSALLAWFTSRFLSIRQTSHLWSQLVLSRSFVTFVVHRLPCGILGLPLFISWLFCSVAPSLPWTLSSYRCSS